MQARVWRWKRLGIPSSEKTQGCYSELKDCDTEYKYCLFLHDPMEVVKSKEMKFYRRGEVTPQGGNRLDTTDRNAFLVPQSLGIAGVPQCGAYDVRRNSGTDEIFSFSILERETWNSESGCVWCIKMYTHVCHKCMCSHLCMYIYAHSCAIYYHMTNFKLASYILLVPWAQVSYVGMEWSLLHWTIAKATPLWPFKVTRQSWAQLSHIPFLSFFYGVPSLFFLPVFHHKHLCCFLPHPFLFLLLTAFFKDGPPHHFSLPVTIPSVSHSRDAHSFLTVQTGGAPSA